MGEAQSSVKVLAESLTGPAEACLQSSADTGQQLVGLLERGLYASSQFFQSAHRIAAADASSDCLGGELTEVEEEGTELA
jgi:hypothetical protein